MRVNSLWIGQPRTQGEGSEVWRSSIVRQQQAKARLLTEAGFRGDAVADTKNHGGVHKAVCAYPAPHYSYWQQHANPAMADGAFGENVTLDGVTEEGVCIGDIYRMGAAVVQVSQPRIPCWKPARRWGVETLTKQMQQTGFTGWYFRVMEPGTVAPGDELTLLQRPHAEFTVAGLNALNYGPTFEAERAAAYHALAELAPPWKRLLARRLRA